MKLLFGKIERLKASNEFKAEAVRQQGKRLERALVRAGTEMVAGVYAVEAVKASVTQFAALNARVKELEKREEENTAEERGELREKRRGCGDCSRTRRRGSFRRCRQHEQLKKRRKNE